MNAYQRREFKLTRSGQHASRLVRLPAEIRLRILRLLLKNDGQFLTRLSTIADDRKWVSLSPEILGTCQSLFHEAYHVLYSDNIASIRIGGRSVPHYTLELDVLGACAYFFLVPGSEHVPCKIEPYTQRRYTDFGTRTLVEALNTLTCFDKICITFLQSDDYMVVSRCLRPFVFNKCVTVDLGPFSPGTESNDPYKLYVTPSQPLFSAACFGIWKCTSIEFQNGCQHRYDRVRRAKLVSLITNSKVQVRDLLPDMWRLNDVFSLLPDLSTISNMPKGLFDNNRTLLLHALYNNDVAVFKYATRHLMEQAREVLSRLQNSRLLAIEWSASLDLSAVDQEYPEEQEDIKDPLRTIWSDRIIERREDQIAGVVKEIDDTWRLMTELLDQDELLSSAEAETTQTSQHATSEAESGSFACSCGSCNDIDGSAWQT